MTAVVCPNGHTSGDPEWCDTCGAPIGGSPDLAPDPAPDPAADTGSMFAVTSVSPTPCPHCGSANDADNLFCEQCGYDFTTGQAPPQPTVTEPPEQTSVVPDSAVKWVVVVEVDPIWYALKGSLADQPCPPASSSTVALTQHTALGGQVEPITRHPPGDRPRWRHRRLPTACATRPRWGRSRADRPVVDQRHVRRVVRQRAQR